jgi:hypothetical protein
MGRRVGVIRKNPRGRSFGEIEALSVPGLTVFFDGAEAKRATGPGGLVPQARVSFEMGGNGRAIKIIKSHLSNVGQAKRHWKMRVDRRGRAPKG